MSNSNVFFLLTRVQHLQRYAKHVEITIACDPNSGFRVELMTHHPRYDRWVFTISKNATDEENEKDYKRLLNVYERYEE